MKKPVPTKQESATIIESQINKVRGMTKSKKLIAEINRLENNIRQYHKINHYEYLEGIQRNEDHITSKTNDRIESLTERNKSLENIKMEFDAVEDVVVDLYALNRNLTDRLLTCLNKIDALES